MDPWIVPGAPLERGEGWRVWYSRPGEDASAPPDPRVDLLGGGQVPVTTEWRALERIDGLERTNGLLTVRLAGPPAGGSTFTVEFPESRERFRWRTLPPPEATDVRFLVSSCFWLNADKEGRFGATVADLTKHFNPAFKVMMGDQVYQDWPPNVVPWQSLPEMYAKRYSKYWGDLGYRRALSSCPTFFSCDDHEFWNNYPDWQPQVPWTWTSADREVTGAAAQLLYHQFQRSANPGARRFYSFQTAGVSIFVADTRSERTEFKAPAPGFFSQPQRDELEAWFDGLSTPGVLVLPQPLFQKDGKWKDRSLSNFTDDFAFLCELFERPLQADEPHDVLIITGDIHTGRYAYAEITGISGRVHEFVASPSARIWQPGRVEPDFGPGMLHPHQRPSWTITVTRDGQTPSTDNHVGLIDVTDGRNGCKRFTLELWRVNKIDDRLYWERGTATPPQPPLQRMLRQEIELR